MGGRLRLGSLRSTDFVFVSSFENHSLKIVHLFHILCGLRVMSVQSFLISRETLQMTVFREFGFILPDGQ